VQVHERRGVDVLFLVTRIVLLHRPQIPLSLFLFPHWQCGFDLAINYKTDDVKAAVAAFAPEGVQHYFDNVGGHITDSVLQVNS
jgi:hypothetical protein